MVRSQAVLICIFVSANVFSQAPSQPQYDISVEQNVTITMRDGVKLVCDIFRPAQNGKAVEGKFPVILEIGLRIPMGRLRALKALAEAAVADPNLFRPFGSIEQTVSRLRTIHGIGEWTAQYIALRAIREMDAFPSTDIGLLSGVASINGNARSAANLLSRAESWRP